MSMAGLRRAGIRVLLVAAAGAFVLAWAPGNPGAVQFAGVGLLWWYAALVGPSLATAVTIVILLAAGRGEPPESGPRA